LEEGFEAVNCALPYATADPEDPLALGNNEPGCDGCDDCGNGLAAPCDVPPPPPPFEGSAEVHIDWPELDATEYIP